MEEGGGTVAAEAAKIAASIAADAAEGSEGAKDYRGGGGVTTDQAEWLHSIQEEMGAILQASVGPEGFWENLQAFKEAVDWSETWIRAIGVFHLCTFITVVATRKLFWPQVVLFLLVCGLARIAERANVYLNSRWTDFSTQNYFDERGVFLGVVWCLPLLLIGFFQLFNFLAMSTSLLVTVKRREFAKDRKDKAAAAGQGQKGEEGGGKGNGKGKAAQGEAKKNR